MVGGVKFKDTKYLSNFYVEKNIDPKYVYINLHANSGVKSEVCVKVNDLVKKGTLIAKAGVGLSVNVFSSVSGKVTEITEFDGKPYVIIENDFKNSEKKLPSLKDYSSQSLIKRLEESGIIGLGGSGFPTFVKYKTDKKIDCLILNGCECENYLTCDDVLMQNKAHEILTGGNLLASIFGLKTFFVGVEDNKEKAIFALREAASKLEGVNAIIVKLKTKYPLGAEKMLVKAITKRIVPDGSIPADVGVVVNNVQTAYAFFNAAIKNMPLTERMVTISGLGVKNRGVTWIKNGTTILDCLEAFGGETFEPIKNIEFSNKIRELRDRERETLDKKQKIQIEKQIKNIVKQHKKDCLSEVSKVVVGGTMMGYSAPSLQIPLGLKDGGVLFLTKNEAPTYNETNCINCKKCIKVCPVRINPVGIVRALEMGDFKTCKALDAKSCFECGCCSFVCPAKINLKEKVIKAKRLK